MPNVSLTPDLLAKIYEMMVYLNKNRTYTIETPYIAFRNGSFNMETFEMEPSDPKKNVIHFLDFELEKRGEDYTSWSGAEMPVFQRFLDTSIVLEDGETPDLETQFLVQEMFGYYLTNNLLGRVSFFLYGPNGHNGKSVICEILRMLIGTKFCTFMTIEQLTTNRFNTSSLISKKLNVCNEESSKFTDSAMFKTLISGEPITAERKNKANFSFKPQTKFLFATNDLPTFKGFSRAMMDRIVIVPMYAEFKGKQASKKDVHLFKKLIPEIPAIARWALDGAKRLVGNNYNFTISEASRNALKAYEYENSSAVAFLVDTYEMVNMTLSHHKLGEFFIPNTSLYLDYKNWCFDNGRQAMNSLNFHKDVKNYGIESFRRRVEGSEPMRGVYLQRKGRVYEASPLDEITDVSIQEDLKI